MKTQLLLMAALLAPLPAVLAQTSVDAPSTSSLGREDFADRSAQELRQLRAQIDELARRASQPSEARFSPLYDALSDADDALAAWKIAGPDEIAQRRADYDKARSRLISMWSDFKTTVGAPGSVP